MLHEYCNGPSPDPHTALYLTQPTARTIGDTLNISGHFSWIISLPRPTMVSVYHGKHYFLLQNHWAGLNLVSWKQTIWMVKQGVIFSCHISKKNLQNLFEWIFFFNILIIFQFQDFHFLCPNDTVFDQQHLVCTNWFEVDCHAQLAVRRVD